MVFHKFALIGTFTHNVAFSSVAPLFQDVKPLFEYSFVIFYIFSTNQYI